MDADTWKIENSICRCCHAEGYFFNLGEPRPFCGQTEVYADMIRDIFDIDMRPLPGPLCELTYTICMSCIFKLREAIQFKKQVQACEDKFLDYYYTNKLEVVKKKDVTQAVIKIEPVVEFKEEYLNEDEFDSNDDTNQDVAMQDDNDDDDDDDDEGSKLVYLLKKGKGKGKGKSESVKAKSEPVKVKSESVKGKSESVKVVVKAESALVKSEQKTTNKKLVKVNKITVPVKKKGEQEEDPRYTITTNEDGATVFSCKICQKVFKKKDFVKQHYKEVHLKMRRRLRSCHLCNVMVPGHQRPAHMEEAHGVPMPKCNVCDRKFAYQFRLLHHQRVFHMGERDYECNVCHKTFGDIKNLNKHLVRHRPERHFLCNVCDKSFKTSKYLQTHMRIHLNDRRCVCKLCGESFVQSSSLKYHMQKRHPEEP